MLNIQIGKTVNTHRHIWSNPKQKGIRITRRKCTLTHLKVILLQENSVLVFAGVATV